MAKKNTSKIAFNPNMDFMLAPTLVVSGSKTALGKKNHGFVRRRPDFTECASGNEDSPRKI
jgi:hypothetical protein